MQIYEILFYLKMRKMRGFAFWTNIWEKRAINLITLTNIVKKKWMKQRHSGSVYAVFLPGWLGPPHVMFLSLNTFHSRRKKKERTEESCTPVFVLKALNKAP